MKVFRCKFCHLVFTKKNRREYLPLSHFFLKIRLIKKQNSLSWHRNENKTAMDDFKKRIFNFDLDKKLSLNNLFV